VETYSLTSPGSGYTAGANQETTASLAGTGWQVNLDTVGLGAVVDYTLDTAGTGYTLTTFQTSTSGSGTGFDIYVSDMYYGIPSGYSLTEAGSGYAVDTYGVTGGTGTGFTLSVTNIYLGGVEEIELVTTGTDYIIDTYATTGGGNGDCTIDVTQIFTSAQIEILTTDKIWHRADGTGSVAMGQDVWSKDNDNILSFGKDFVENTADSFNVGFGQRQLQVTDGKVNVHVLPIGTLASPPTGLVQGDIWMDTTDSASNPILRINVS
jgi:hypothetical protein